MGSDWGKTADGGHDGIAAIFIERAGGSWTGGKFDWTGFVGKPRPLGHLADYNDWNDNLPLPKGTRIAFVLVEGERSGRRRTNVAICTVQ